jgi:hypothetical protein
MRVALLLALAGFAAAPQPAGDVPTRAELTQALDRWDGRCAAGPPGEICTLSARRIVRRLRCRPDAAEDRPARLLCTYSGVATYTGRIEGRWPNRRFGPECLWLGRDAAGAWQVQAFPDADLCEH